MDEPINPDFPDTPVLERELTIQDIIDHKHDQGRVGLLQTQQEQAECIDRFRATFGPVTPDGGTAYQTAMRIIWLAVACFATLC